MFARNKRTILVVVCSTALTFLLLMCMSATLMTESKMMEISEPPTPTIKIEHYDVLLSSYMRSGSTLTGIVFGHRDDAFYLYEPLWKMAQWTYWRGNNTVCRSDRHECRIVEPGKTVAEKNFSSNYNGMPEGSLVTALTILKKFYDCQFDDFERAVCFPKLTVKLGGPGWSQVDVCLRGNETLHYCLLKFIPSKCKNATHRVAKILRLTTDHLGPFLLDHENLKVVHLFRDPRAIINSRSETGWYPSHTPKKLIESAEALCSKMLYDFREGKKLLKLYPDRFKFIYYEDLNDNPLEKIKKLYKYLGMDLDEKKYNQVMKLPVVRTSTKGTARQKNTAFWWRRSLDWKVVQKMESVCREVYKELGYKSMSNLKEYTNLSISSLDIPKEFLIT